MLARDSNGVLDASRSQVLACVYMSSPEAGKIFLRVSPTLKAKWVEMCKERRVNQNLAGTNLVEWVVIQDPEIQLAVLGSKPATAQELAVLIKRLGREVPRSEIKLQAAHKKTVHQTPKNPPR